MASESGGAADFNRPHDAQLLKRQTARFAVVGAILPENTGQFVNRPGHSYGFFGRGLAVVSGFPFLSSWSSGLTVAETTCGATRV